MTPQAIFHDFNLVCQMDAPIPVKVRILTHLLAAQENPWRVVGITKDALKVFKEYSFRKKAKMGINRSHIKERHESYIELINSKNLNIETFWSLYYENDKTILATSSENMKRKFSEIFDIQEGEKLFKSKGYSWNHTKKETKFLQELYQSVFGDFN